MLEQAGSRSALAALSGGNSNEARLQALERRLAGLPSPSTSSRDAHSPPQDGEAQHMNISTSPEQQNQTITKLTLGPATSPAPKVHYESEEDDGSRDAFSLPAANAAAQPVPTLQANNGSLKRKQPLAGQERRVSLGSDGSSKHRSPSPGLPISHLFGPSLKAVPAEQSPNGKVHINVTEGGKQGNNSLHKTPQSIKKQRNTINSYFPARPDHLHMRPAVAMADAGCQAGACSLREAADGPVVSFSQQEQQMEVLQQQLDLQRVRADQDSQALSHAQREVEQLAASVSTLQQALKQAEEAAAKRRADCKAAVLKLAQQACDAERQLSEFKLRADGLRLGTIGAQRTGPLGLREVWVEGQAFQDLSQRQHRLAEQKEAIEMARKAVKRKLPPPEPLSQDVPMPSSGEYIAPEEYVARDEIFKTRIASLKREEEALQKERDRLEFDKQRHIRELKRVKDEEASRFTGGLVMNERYLLLKLIGKGGFSEVFQALDLDTHTEVAVKVHQLSSSWSEGKKASYVKHAIREYNIHRSLRHPRVVGLMDIFEIDAHTFATVLEFCRGGELETHLKEHGTLPEKEARVIISQVCSGLAYLNDTPRRIIHYDLKPANIMFDSYGQVKLTDFGLSKIVEEGEASAMELTSQGAGTYWYLPPECFEVGPRPPLISNKVDVWSVGVVLYQMLYGRRPFGEGCSQEKILRDEIMLHAKEVAFPSKPAVSAEGKDFILKCLAYRQQDRLDVHAAASHTYCTLRRPRQQGHGSGG